MSTTSKWLLYILLLSALAAIAFHNMAEHHFSHDDSEYIHNAAIAQNHIGYVFSADKAWSGRPTNDFLLFLFYKWAGESPGPYHLLNVFLHLIAGILLARLVLRVTQSEAIAALTGLLFLLHCSHFRGFYWIASIGYPTAAIFLILSLLCFLETLRSPNPWPFSILSAGLFLLSLGAHLGTLPALAVIYLCIPLKKAPARAIQWMLPHIILSLGFLIAVQWVYPAQVASKYYVLDLRIVKNFFWFIYKLFAEAHIILSNPIRPTSREWLWGIPILAPVVCTLWRPISPIHLWAALAWLTMLIFLPFEISISEDQDLNTFSRHFYLPSLGTSALLGHAFIALYRRISPAPLRHTVAAAVLCIVCTSSVYWLRKLEGVQYGFSGHYFHGLGHQDIAREQFRKSIQKYPGLSPNIYIGLAVLTSSPQDAARIEEGCHFFPDDPDLNLAAGILHLRSDSTEKAVPYIQKAFELDGKNPDLYYRLGIFYASRNRHSDAAGIYKKARHIQPDNGRILFRLAQTYHSLNQLDKSLETYQRVLDLEKDNALAWFGLGRVLQETNQAVPAEKAFETAFNAHLRKVEEYRHSGEEQIRYLGLAPSPTFMPNLCLILGRAAYEKKQADPARAYFALGLEKTHPTPEFETLRTALFKGLGRILYDTGLFDQALDLALQIRGEQALDTKTLDHIIQILHQKDRIAEAIPFLRKAVELAPDNAHMWINLANSYLRLGRYAPALEAAQSAVRHGPDNAKAYVNLGLASEKLGLTDRAIPAYQKAILLDPSNHLLKKHLATLQAPTRQ